MTPDQQLFNTEKVNAMLNFTEKGDILNLSACLRLNVSYVYATLALSLYWTSMRQFSGTRLLKNWTPLKLNIEWKCSSLKFRINQNWNHLRPCGRSHAKSLIINDVGPSTWVVTSVHLNHRWLENVMPGLKMQTYQLAVMNVQKTIFFVIFYTPNCSKETPQLTTMIVFKSSLCLHLRRLRFHWPYSLSNLSNSIFP